MAIKIDSDIPTPRTQHGSPRTRDILDALDALKPGDSFELPPAPVERNVMSDFVLVRRYAKKLQRVFALRGSRVWRVS